MYAKGTYKRVSSLDVKSNSNGFTAKFGVAEDMAPPATCLMDCCGSWSTWSACSVSCGAGRQQRNFVPEIKSRNGGAKCPSPMSRQCRKPDCPVDCKGQWSAWGPCPGVLVYSVSGFQVGPNDNVYKNDRLEDIIVERTHAHARTHTCTHAHCLLSNCLSVSQNRMRRWHNCRHH